MKSKLMLFFLSICISFAISGCIFKHPHKDKGAKKRADNVEVNNTKQYVFSVNINNLKG